MKKFWQSLVLIFVVSAAYAGDPYSEILWYDSDAGNTFTNAIPIGNGYMGGMIYGGVEKDVINLNEGTVWSGGPGDNNKAGAADKLPSVRAALFTQDYKLAESIAGQMVGYQPAAYQPVGDLNLLFSGHKGTNYRRELDLSTAISKTTYTYNGVEYTREYFANYPDKVIVIRLTANQTGKISFEASFTSPHGNKSFSTLNNNILMMNGTINSIKFQSRLRISTDGGTVSAGSGKLTVSGANSATIILNIASNFKSYNDVTGDPSTLTSKVIDQVSTKTYDALKSAHLKDYQALYNRVRLNLGTPASSAGDITTNRVKSFNSNDDPSFVELYYQFGRYLMISSSRAGGQPANLQGIWNRDLSPAWGSKYTTNINLEMNYWMVESANLQECIIPLVDKIKAMVAQGSKTAKVHWGTDKGWVVHHNTDLWNRTAPIDGSWGVWPTGAGWLSTHLWEHYLFTQNKDFLKDVYPTLKSAAEFLLAILVEEPVSGKKYLVTAPSASPENTHGGYNVCFAPTMDNQIIRDAFNYVIEASKVLGVDNELRIQLEAAVKRLPPDQIGKHSQLQEWFFDWDDPRSDHRHVSHLYGLFPSAQISVDETKNLADGAKQTLIQRGDLATGWSLAWKINLWARLQDGDHAYNLVRLLLTPDRTYNNLFDAHPPFQIDGNFGAVSGINEMLLQSQGGKIRILPALPSKWATGNIAGIRARGGVVVDSLAWKDGKFTYLKLTSENNTPLHLEYAGKTFSITTKSGSSYELDGNLKLLNQPFEAVVIPARIQAEDYVEMSGVEIETGSDNEVNIGWINDGDWVSFLVRSPSAATFKWRISVGSAAEEASEIILKDSSGNVLARQTIDLTKTTGWNDWYETETDVELPAGVQKLTMEFTGTSTYLVNVNWIEFENTTLFASALKMDAQQQNRPCQIFDMNGKYLGQLNVQNWNQVVDLMKGNNYSRGVYLVMDKANAKVVHIK